MQVIEAVENVNEKQKGLLFAKLSSIFDGHLEGKTIAIWGLSFKPETDDMREAPALVLIDKLLDAGCNVRVYDPIAMEECERKIGDSVYYASDLYDAADGANALMLLTEWKEFRSPVWNKVADKMKQKVVLDGRNIYDRKEMEESGFIYRCIGY